MKRHLLFSVAAAMATMSLMAGGLVTNTNQSASWIRNPARDASRGIDAVYYNPAGIMGLSNGLHFSINNQSIFQNKEVDNYYPFLNQSAYKGKVSAPLFPGVYAVYKMDKIAFSFGFNPIGGGGGAKFDKGLPSFEMSPSDLVPGLAKYGVTNYKLNAYFEGTSVFFGYQAGITYKINDMVSVFGGVRYVTAKNTYAGHLNDVQIEQGGSWLRADAFFNGMGASLGKIIAIPSNLQPIVDGGGSGFNLAQVQGAGYIDQATHDGIVQGLQQLGISSQAAEAMTIAQIQGAVTMATPTLSAQRATVLAKAHLLRNQSADAKQTGSGICPILGLNLTLSENLNIGIKYEFLTKIELTNSTTKDFTTYWAGPSADSVTMFPDGVKSRSDMPAMLSVGADYKLGEKLHLNLGTHYYFDKNANYGKRLDYDMNPSTPTTEVSNSTIIDKNFYEIAAGLEYNMNEKILLSGGYLFAKTGVNTLYQNDLSYSNTSNTFGIGCQYTLNEKVNLNIGVAYTVYKQAEKFVDHVLAPENYLVKETYSKSNLLFGIGADISLSK